jgi:2-methylcitrate dehydratase PrpD
MPHAASPERISVKGLKVENAGEQRHGMAPTEPAITRQLAEFIHRTTWEDIQPIFNTVQCGFLDFIGLASYAGRHIDTSSVFTDAVNNMSADGPGTVLGLGRTYQTQYSALLNGTFVHSMDWDDTNSVASLHPGASAFAAALAQAEREMADGRVVSGREFYAAVAVGYEVTCRLGRSISDIMHRVGFHPTCVAGVFGAAAAAGKLAGLNADRINNLFGIVGSMASGSLQCFVNGGWNKRFHPGIAAHNALLGVQFAKAGMVGASEAIEGKRGLLMSYGRMSEPDAHIVEQLGSYWETCNTAIKPYPCCRLAHAPIEAAYELRKLFGSPDAIPKDTAIEITVGPKAYGGVGTPAANKLDPTNVVEAQFSVYFQFSVALLYGHNDWESYKLLQDENVLEMNHRIRVHQDDSLRDGSLVTVAKIGDKTVKIEFPLGEPENPMLLPQVQNKFDRMADQVYGVERRQEILKLFFDLENQADLSVFVRSLRA